jgi:hypothetical protein
MEQQAVQAVQEVATRGINVYSLLIVFVLQCLGAHSHWRLMLREGRVSGGFFRDYLFADYPGKTATTIFLIALSSWLAALGGAADYLNPQLVYTLLVSGSIDPVLGAAITGGATTAFMAGYGFDSRFNKGGSKPEDQEEGK